MTTPGVTHFVECTIGSGYFSDLGQNSCPQKLLTKPLRHAGVPETILGWGPFLSQKIPENSQNSRPLYICKPFQSIGS